MKKLIIIFPLIFSGIAFAGGQMGGGGGGGGSALKQLGSDTLSQIRLNQLSTVNLREALVLPQDFKTIVNKSLLKEPVVIDDQEFIGVNIEESSVELAPSQSPTESNLLVRPAE